MLSASFRVCDMIRWLIQPLSVAVLVAVAVVGLLKRWKALSTHKSPPGNSGWPFLGETLHFLASAYTSDGPLSFMQRRSSMYGKVFKTNILGSEVIVSADAEVNKMILQNQGNVFVPAYPKSIRELMGQNSILQMNGNSHRKLHYLISRFLRSPLLKSAITSHIQCSVTRCLSSWHHRPLVYVQDEVKNITFTVLVRVLISMDPGQELDALKREFEEFIKGLICLPIKFPGTRLYKSLKAKERMMETVRKIVEKRKMTMTTAAAMTTEGGARDGVEALLAEEGMTVEGISENIIEMMIPGEETLPTAMTLAVHFLSHSPLSLSHLREENMVLKKHKMDRCEDYVWNDYMSLSFTQNVISETLRLANIVNAIWRKATKDVDIKGYTIPKGNIVVASLMSVHMDGRMYEKPYEFNPWRWEGIEERSKNGYSPFGGGQRLCPGLEVSRLELSIFLHHLVTTYIWHAHPDHIIYFPTVKMSRSLPITVKPL